MNDEQDRDRAAELRVLIAYIVAPAIAFIAVSNWLIGSGWLVDAIDRHRPEDPRVMVNVELQMLHLEARHRRPMTVPTVAFTGSSSVVNGIDTAIFDSAWADLGIEERSVNAGLTMLASYELPLLKHYLLAPGVVEVVYLYNGFSFSDRYHPDALGSRFDLAEFVRLFGWRTVFTEDFYKGVLGQYVFVVRYRNLLHYMATGAVRGELVLRRHDYDYAPGHVVEGPIRGRECEEAAPNTEFARIINLESSAGTQTVGYRALERFLDLARARSIRVTVAPIPEPDFAGCGRWRRDIPQASVDERVARLARDRGARFLAPDSAFDEDDRLFRDHVHMSDSGRQRYSTWLAERLAVGWAR